MSRSHPIPSHTCHGQRSFLSKHAVWWHNILRVHKQTMHACSNGRPKKAHHSMQPSPLVIQVCRSRGGATHITSTHMLRSTPHKCCGLSYNQLARRPTTQLPPETPQAAQPKKNPHPNQTPPPHLMLLYKHSHATFLWRPSMQASQQHQLGVAGRPLAPADSSSRDTMPTGMQKAME